MARNSLATRVGSWLKAFPKSGPARVLLILGLVLPTLISAIYMWVMWDPEVYLRQVPVAVASDDLGAVVDGKPENIGAGILDSLVSGNDLQFHRVSSAEALDGLRESRYAFSVIIPSDFTRDISTITDPEPVHARIMVWYNDFNGTLGPSVANGVVADAERQITASIGREYAGQLLVGINRLGAGLSDASQGVSQAASGSNQLADGSAQLATGLDQAFVGATTLVDGTGQLRAGTAQLATGATQLVGGTDQLGSGAVQIQDGVDQIVTPVLAVLDPLDQLTTELAPVLDQLANSSDPSLTAAATQLRALINQVRRADPSSITAQLAQLHNGTRELARQLTDPHADYRAGVLALANGATQLRDGSTAIDHGMNELATGIRQLSVGGHQLQSGAAQLNDGMRQLDVGLRDGSAAAPHVVDRNASAMMFSEPFTIDVRNQEPSELVVGGDRSRKIIAGGAGPVIVILATFLAAIVVWMLLKPLRSSTIGGSIRHRALHTVRGRTLQGVVAGIVTAAAAAGYGKSVGWEPQNWPSMIAVVILVGITAAVTTHMFVVLLGRLAGSITAFGFYMFQIFAFGGVFPPGTTPSAFEPFENISPMTFARRAIIRCDIALYDRMFWVSIGMLIAMIVFAAVVTVSAQYLRLRAQAEEQPDHAGDLAHV
ncbi:YhgE/Pip domain-containing protein [Nocardia vinacea]|uniref:YhgE/Pip domain-containing protein n=1 Tax=Nocardia vinacea TaxID=96468 RepID=UPI000315CD18|nr:YhgE/Pip domain-containing protein [Nocardia vinacea]